MHGCQSKRQACGLLETHRSWNGEKPAVIGHGIFGVTAGTGTHHAISDLHILRIRPKLDHFARELHTEYGADAACSTMDVTRNHPQIGPVHAAGVNLDQNLRAFRRGLRDIGDGSATGAVDEGFHGDFPNFFAGAR